VTCGIDIILRMLRRLLQKLFAPAEPDSPVSAVLLLRAPAFYLAADVEAAAIRAFGNAPQTEKRFVVQGEWVTVLVVGPHIFNVLSVKRTYDIEEPPAPTTWAQHHAWCALDHMNKDETLRSRVAALARIAAELADENCVGVYFPHTGILFPNDSDLKSKILALG
jgi:hypothetical protein